MMKGGEFCARLTRMASSLYTPYDLQAVRAHKPTVHEMILEPSHVEALLNPIDNFRIDIKNYG